MRMKIGETIEHGGEKFVIVNIDHSVSSEGAILVIRAFDPDMARVEQMKNIKMEETKEGMMELLKKITESGLGNIGGMGG